MSIYDGDSVAAYVRGQAKIKEKNRRVRRQVTKEISDIDSLSDSEKQTLIDDYLRKMDSDALSTRIAPIFGGRIQNVSKYGEGGTLGVPIQALTSGDKAPISQAVKTAYGKITPDTFIESVTTPKVQAPKLFYQRILGNVAQMPASAFQGINNILKHNGESVLWDLETLGATYDEGGRKLGQFITEFSFSHVQGDITNNAFDASTGIKRTYGSIIGINDEMKKQIGELSRRYFSGQELTQDEVVTLNRLALAGSEKTKLNTSRAAEGLYTFDNFAEQGDIKFSKAEVERGLKLYNDIYHKQEATAVNGMRGWEKELLTGLHTIVDNDLTAIGHNTEVFDIRQLSYLATSQYMGDAAKQEINKLFGGSAIKFKHNFDDLHVERMAAGNSAEFYRQLFTGHEHLLPQQMKWMRDEGKTAFTQEALLHAYELIGGAKVQSGAHNAKEDAIGTATLVYKMGLFNPNDPNSLINRLPNNPYRLSADGTEVFYANKSGYRQDGILSFVGDPMNNTVRTSDAVTITGTGAKEELFQQTGERRRGLYILKSNGRIGRGDPLYQSIIEAHPELDFGSLDFIHFRPYSDSKTVSAESDIWKFGTPHNLEVALSQMTFAGNIDENGNYSLDNVAKDERKALSLYSTDSHGKVEVIDPTPEGLKAQSTLAFDNDAAARAARELNATKDAGLIRYITDMDEAIPKIYGKINGLPSVIPHMVAAAGSEIDIYRRKYAQDMMDRTTHTATEIANNPKYRPSAKSFQNTLYQYFGWESDGTMHLYSNTASNMTQLENYGRRNFGIIQASLDFAKKQSGTDNVRDKAFKIYYRYARQALQEQAVLQANEGVTKLSKLNNAPIGWRRGYRVASEMENIFEVDLNGFNGIKAPEGRIRAFKIHGGEWSMATSLLKEMGYNDRQIQNFTQENQVKIIGDFQKFLVDKHVIEENKDYIVDLKNDSTSMAASKIIHGFSQAREKDPTKGFLSPIGTYDVINSTEKNQGLSVQTIYDTLDRISKNKLGIIPFSTGKDPKKAQQAFDNATNKIADNIVDKILFNTGFVHEESEEFVEKLKAQGYSEKSAKLMQRGQQLKRAKTREVVRDLVGEIYRNGGAIGYNEETGKIWGYNSVNDFKAGKSQELFFTKERYEDGTFFVRQGKNNTRRIDPIGLFSLYDRGSHGKKLQVNSLWGKASGNVGTALHSNFLEKKAEEGELLGGVDFILGKFNRTWGDFSTSLDTAKQDRLMSQSFYAGDIVQKLGELSNTKVFRDFTGDGSDAGNILKDLMDKARESYLENNKELFENGRLDDLTMAQVVAVQEHGQLFEEAIQEVINNGSPNGDVYSMIRGFSRHLGTHSSKGFYRIYQENQNVGENAHTGANGIEYKKARAAYFEASEDTLRYLDTIGGNAGDLVRTVGESARNELLGKNLGYRVESSFIGRRLSTSTRDYQILLDKGAKALGLSLSARESSEFTRIASIMTDEGAGAITSRAADAMLSYRYYEQQVDVDRVRAVESNANDVISKRSNIGDATPELELGDDGKVHFHSNNGVFRKKDEKLFSVLGAYDEGEKSVLAKSNGYLRLGIFQDRMRLSDERVSEIINENLDKIDTSREGWQERVWNFFNSDKTYKARYFLEDMDMSGNVKISDNNEKTVGRIIMNGLGQKDRKVAKVLTDFKAMDLIGQEVTADFISELMNPPKDLSKTKFGIALNALTDGSWNDERIRKTIDNTFSSVEDFANAMMTERHSATDLLEHVMTAGGALKEGQHVWGVMNNYSGQIKHGDPSAFSSMFYAMRDKGMSDQDILREMKKVRTDLEYDEKTKTFTLSHGSIDWDAYDKIAHEHFGTNNYFELSKGGKKVTGYIEQLDNGYYRKFDMEGKEVGTGKTVDELLNKGGYAREIHSFEKVQRLNDEEAVRYGQRYLYSNTALSRGGQLQNLDMLRITTKDTARQNRKPEKLDERILTNIFANKLNEDYLNTAQQRLVHALGEEKGNEIYDKFIKGAKAGDNIDQSLIDTIKARQFYTDSEDRLYDKTLEEHQKEFVPQYKQLKEESGKARQKLIEKGMTGEQIDSVLATMKEAGATKITADKVLAQHMAFSFSAARKYNSDKTLTNEDMKKLGFNVVSLGDLNMQAKASGMEEFTNQLYGRSLLIDLHDDKLPEDAQIYKKSGQRYLALPFTKDIFEKENGVLSPGILTGDIAALLRGYREYSDNYEKNVDVDGAREEALGKAQKAIDRFVGHVSKLTTSKDGVVKKASTAYFGDGVIRATAQGHDFAGGVTENGEYRSLDGNFSKLEWQGINLSKMADVAREDPSKALNFSYGVVGKNAANAIYNDNYFMELTGGNADLATQLKKLTLHEAKTTGTLSDVLRQPAQQNTSFAASALYINDTVGDDEILVGVRGWMQKKGDFDSDKGDALVRRSSATIEIGNKKVHTDSLDYAGYKALQKMEGIKVELDDGGKAFKDAIASTVHTALTFNQYDDRRDASPRMDDLDTHSVRDATYDGRHSVDFDRVYTPEEEKKYAKLNERLNETFAPIAEKKNLEKGSTDYLKEMSDYVRSSGKYSEDAQKELLESMHYAKTTALINQKIEADASKLAAGSLNTSIFEWMRTMTNFEGNRDTHGYLNLTTTTEAAIQEATLTGKSEKHGDLTRSEELSKLNARIYSVMGGKGGKEEASSVANEAREMYYGLLSTRTGKEFARLSSDVLDKGTPIYEKAKDFYLEKLGQDAAGNAEEIASINRGEITNGMKAAMGAQLVHDAVETMVSPNSWNFRKAMKIGISQNGLNEDTHMFKVENGASESLLTSTEEMINRQAKSLGVDSNIYEDALAPQNRSRAADMRTEKAREAANVIRENSEIAEKRREEIEEAAVRASSHRVAKAVRGIASMAEHAGNPILAGAIGIAGGLLTSGYVSGPMNSGADHGPSDQAQSASYDEDQVAQMQQAPSLSDANLNVMRGGPNSGYVINVNATSPQGQQRAVEAIQNAASGLTPQNGSVNISMSSTIGSTASQYHINRMVSNAIGMSS